MASPNGFPRSCRLTKTDEFSSVFVFKCSVRGNFLHLIAKPNHLEHARFGVVVGKKVARRAVARNYMKRVMREIFRQHLPEIANLDIIARIHKLFVKKDFVVIREELEKLFAGLNKCRTRSSS